MSMRSAVQSGDAPSCMDATCLTWVGSDKAVNDSGKFVLVAGLPPTALRGNIIRGATVTGGH